MEDINEVNNLAGGTNDLRGDLFGMDLNYHTALPAGLTGTPLFNGNITRDPHRGLTIAYNHLNKPTSATFDNGDAINWIYSADGTQLWQEVSGSTTNTHDYLGAFFYVDDGLLHFAMRKDVV